MLIETRYSDRGDIIKMSMMVKSVIKILREPEKPDSVTVHDGGDERFAEWLGQMVGLGMWAANQPRIMTQVPTWMRNQLKLE